MPAVRTGAPARPLGCAGALLFLLLAGACGDAAPEPVLLELGADTVRLPAGVALLEVDVGGGAAEFEPGRLEARVGDVVRFTARDLGSHAIVFVEAGLDPAARDFLQQSGQLRGPPLLEPGTAWVVSLAGAPPGEYPFRCVTHGRTGTLTVGPAADPRRPAR